MKKKIFTMLTVLLLLGIILTGLLSLSFIRISYIDKIEEMLLTNSKLINSLVEDRINSKEVDEIDFSNLAYEYGGKINTRITFVDINGRVIGDSEIKPSNLNSVENHKNRPEIKKAFQGEIGKSKRYSTTIDTDYFYVAIPIMENDQIVGATRLAYPLDEINRINIGLIKNILISIIVGLAAAVLLGYRYVNHVTEPIKEMTSIAQKIANGHLNSRVYVDSSDEVKILADTFNLMAEKLKINILELQDKNTKLKSIVSSMKEGLIAVDNHNKIMMINPAAKGLFNIEDSEVKGKGLLSLIKNEEMREHLEIIFMDNGNFETEITINQINMKILKIYTDCIRLDDDPNRIIGTLILIQDVTEVRKLEKMRTDFVANVSHELKTPLTSIMGFVETLKNGAIDNENVRDKFLNIIEIETERLTRLIEDLLTLSNIEGNKLSFANIEEIPVKTVISEIDHMMFGIAQQKDIVYISEVDEDLPYIIGSRDWFKQMILNLVDNAIKYTPKGGTVKVTSYKKEKNIFISIKDTGIGIPKKDIPRLFERFYRVDKARSRKVGGTGLGLAIVKHIVIAFKGEIKVKSEEGRGTEFIVRIPL